MFGSKIELSNIMQQAQKAQQAMKKLQDELAITEVNGDAGAGMVKVAMYANHQVKSFNIAVELCTKENKKMLEDLIVAAVNTASRQAMEIAKKKAQEATGGFIPSGYSMPF